MRRIDTAPYTGVAAALGAAVLFGAGTPLAKLLLDSVNPWLLAGLLYIGSGLGLTLYRCLIKAPAVKLAHQDAAWFTGAVVSGGIVGPVLLMMGLTGMPASGASLLLMPKGFLPPCLPGSRSRKMSTGELQSACCLSLPEPLF